MKINNINEELLALETLEDLAILKMANAKRMTALLLFSMYRFEEAALKMQEAAVYNKALLPEAQDFLNFANKQKENNNA